MSEPDYDGMVAADVIVSARLQLAVADWRKEQGK